MKPSLADKTTEAALAARLLQTRRSFLGRSTLGLGSAALHGLLCRDARGNEAPAMSRADAPENASRLAHHVPRARRVIYLYMAGGPSHLETFDEKPNLATFHGKPIPASVTGGQQLSPLNRCPTANWCWTSCRVTTSRCRWTPPTGRSVCGGP